MIIYFIILIDDYKNNIKTNNIINNGKEIIKIQNKNHHHHNNSDENMKNNTLIKGELNNNLIKRDKSKKKNNVNSSSNIKNHNIENEYLEKENTLILDSRIKTGKNEKANIVVNNNIKEEKNENIISYGNDIIDLTKIRGDDIKTIDLKYNNKSRNHFFQNDTNYDYNMMINKEKKYINKNYIKSKEDNISYRKDLINNNDKYLQNIIVPDNIDINSQNICITRNDINNNPKCVNESYFIQIKKYQSNQLIEIKINGRVLYEKNVNEFNSTGTK
ncbi:hypothetical protein BCR36DRAFT_46684 [Piromyces finnis]|uniref:Uncharacterized protein n=1 Tax=Piromyces finnis TaxID=1754191 RepID=A0A1Y1VLR9_9FUNG|nr:hypothetical protein BCR36DRAFT_46684 [Piromyces finnis]|eukprot:ORX59848.1 hypothetical protein BCR36DRAFT_46684 [Piromyces finnis]